jgi:hypothetical protein
LHKKIMRIEKARLIFSFLFLVLLAGCASLYPQRIPEALNRPAECQDFLEALDEKVLDAGVRDASTFPIPDFPYLRTDRFLSTMKERPRDEKEKEQWLRWMQALDLQAREREIDDLPGQMVLPISAKEGLEQGRQGVRDLVRSCS